MSNAAVTFEHITYDYYWGCYGTFKVIINRSTGYVNATQLCRARAQASVAGWIRANSGLIDAVAASLEMQRERLIVTHVDGPEQMQGTYVHTILAPHLAAWVSPALVAGITKVISKYTLDGEVAYVLRRYVAEEPTFAKHLAARMAVVGEPSVTASRPCCVYLIRAGEYTTIGYTYDLTERLSTLQSCNPITLTITCMVITVSPVQVLRDIYELFEGNHVNSTWFILPEDAGAKVRALHSN